jgi:hypothetical protein
VPRADRQQPSEAASSSSSSAAGLASAASQLRQVRMQLRVVLSWCFPRILFYCASQFGNLLSFFLELCRGYLLWVRIDLPFAVGSLIKLRINIRTLANGRLKGQIEPHAKKSRPTPSMATEAQKAV